MESENILKPDTTKKIVLKIDDWQLKLVEKVGIIRDFLKMEENRQENCNPSKRAIH